MTQQLSTTHEFDIFNDQTLAFNVSKEGLQETDEAICC